MKRIFAAALALGICLSLAIVSVGCSTLFAGSSVNLTSNTSATSWTVTADSVNGHSSRTVRMTADNLAALTVTSSNSDGTVELVLTEGSVTQTYDLSGSFSDGIDTSAFTPGKIQLRLNYTNAKGVNISIRWDGK